MNHAKFLTLAARALIVALLAGAPGATYAGSAGPPIPLGNARLRESLFMVVLQGAARVAFDKMKRRLILLWIGTKGQDGS